MTPGKQEIAFKGTIAFSLYHSAASLSGSDAVLLGEHTALRVFPTSALAG